jgi:hypothetical protein
MDEVQPRRVLRQRRIISETRTMVLVRESFRPSKPRIDMMPALAFHEVNALRWAERALPAI